MTPLPSSSERLDPSERERVNAAIDAAIDLALRERIRLGSVVAALWGVAFLPLHHVLLGAAITGPLVAVAVAFVALCVAGGLLASRTQTHRFVINLTGTVLPLCWVAVSAVMNQATGHVVHFRAVLIVLIAMGLIFLRSRWYALFLACATALLVAFGRPPDHSLDADLVVLGSTLVLSVLVHVTSKRVVYQLYVLRARDESQRAAVEAALAEARKQLADRERAEAERLRVEAEGAALREQLAHAQKMEALGTLAGGLAHDMNNVLGGILGVAEIMRDDAPPSMHEDIDSIIESTKRGAELTRNLVGFARRGKYREVRVDLAATVDELLRILRRTVPKGVEFATEIASPAPAVDGDPSLITQSLINLCLNSVDAMRGVGKITIAVREVELDAAQAARYTIVPGSYVAITVTDTGSGMDAATVQRIFEPFFTTKEVGRGTGLGLPMVHGTVRAYGGAIDVASEPGKGTSITLYLPPASAERSHRTPTSSTHRAVAAGTTILVVDDDPRVSRLIRRILEGKGHRVLVASDGQEGVACYAANPEIDLVLLDMAMPVMNGRDCFRALRTADPSARVLLVSGYTMEQDARACLDEGALGFVDKPFTVDSLVRAVTDALAPPAPPVSAA